MNITNDPHASVYISIVDTNNNSINIIIVYIYIYIYIEINTTISYITFLNK